MSITIDLPDEVEAQLQRAAATKHCSVEELAMRILTDAAGSDSDVPSLEEIVARIRATPPNPQSIRAATGSLASVLANAPRVSDFDRDAWEQQWAAVEQEMKSTTRANDLAEGRT